MVAGSVKAPEHLVPLSIDQSRQQKVKRITPEEVKAFEEKFLKKKNG